MAENKYVVTGGAGFIGSTLVRKLLEKGQVEVVDNLLTGHRENLEEVRSRVVLHEIDIQDRAALQPVFEGADTVFHLAAIPSVPRSIADPDPSHAVNINGTYSVFSAARDAGVRRVVYAASSSAYGDTLVLPKTESMKPLPKSPYAAQKLMGEYYASVFHSCFDLETVSLRFFNVFGPRQDPSSPYSGVLSLFMKHLLARTSPTIFGDGEQSRDFTYVEDVVALNLKAARAQGVSGKMYNGGNGGRVTLNQAWELLQRFEGVRIAPNYGPPREGDVRDSQADTTAVSRDLGHTPRYSFEEGLRLTLEWYRENNAPA